MLQVIWGWQPALYLFLGGMGAGAFVVAAALFLIDNKRHKKIVCASMWTAAAALVAGLLLLLTELSAPIRGMLLWQSFSNFSSWMTYGAWGLLLAVSVFGASALLATPAIYGKLLDWTKKGKEKTGSNNPEDLLCRIRRILAATGIALGVFVAFYTGMLLMSAPGVPLWNTMLLPLLFLISGVDTGVALVEIIAVSLSKKDDLAPKAGRLLEKSVIALVLIECLLLATFLFSQSNAENAAHSAEMLISGILAPYFWGMVVICGLILPLFAAILQLVAKKGASAKKTIMTIGAIGALIGGCELRFLILAAGLHSDLISQTILSVI